MEREDKKGARGMPENKAIQDMNSEDIKRPCYTYRRPKGFSIWGTQTWAEVREGYSKDIQMSVDEISGKIGILEKEKSGLVELIEDGKIWGEERDNLINCINDINKKLGYLEGLLEDKAYITALPVVLSNVIEHQKEKGAYKRQPIIDNKIIIYGHKYADVIFTWDGHSKDILTVSVNLASNYIERVEFKEE